MVKAQTRGTFWVGDIVSFYNVGVIHLIKLISDDMSAWEYRAGHEARDLFAARAAPKKNRGAEFFAHVWSVLDESLLSLFGSCA